MLLGSSTLASPPLAGKRVHSAGEIYYPYSTFLTDKEFQKNIVIKIGDDYFADYQPDAGLDIDSLKCGVLRDLTLASGEIDLKDAKTSLGNVAFSLVDKDGALSAWIGGKGNSLYTEDVEIWYGRIDMLGTGVPHHFNGYKKLTTARITNADYQSGAWNFSAVEITSLMNVDVFSVKNTLSADLTAVATTINVTDTTEFASAGLVKIGDEFISYEGKTSTTLTGCTRGLMGSTADTASRFDEIFQVYQLGPQTPMLTLVQLLVSNGGGGDYDVLADGCGIDPALIDIDGILALDTTLGNPLFTYYVYNMGNALEWIENNLLLANNVRLVMKDGLISAVYLAEYSAPGSYATFSESCWEKTPRYKKFSEFMSNQIAVKIKNSGQYQLDRPHGICTDGTYLYVTDQFNNRIVKTDFTGLFVANWGSAGSGNNNYNLPAGICTDGTYLYVADVDNSRIVKTDLDGNYVDDWETKNGFQLVSPKDICTDGTYLYVVAWGLSGSYVTIQKYTLAGVLQTEWGSYGGSQSKTLDPNKYRSPLGICTDGTYLYVCDSKNKRIQKTDLIGTWVSAWYAAGGSDMWECKHIIYVSGTGYLYVTDSMDRVLIYNTSGTYQATFGSSGDGDDNFGDFPQGLLANGSYLYVCDQGHSRVKKHLLASPYTYQDQWGNDELTQVDESRYYSDAASIAAYGPKPWKQYALGCEIYPGDTYIDEAMALLLYWISTPKAKIEGKTSWPLSETNIGDIVRVTHRYLPDATGLTLDGFFLVVGKKINASKSTVEWTLLEYPA